MVETTEENMFGLMVNKNRLIRNLQNAKANMRAIAVEAAFLEGKIAERLIAEGRVQSAVTNLISQASCLIDADQKKKAIAVYKRAHHLCDTDTLRQEIAYYEELNKAEYEKTRKRCGLDEDVLQ